MQAYHCKASKTFVKQVGYIFEGENARKKVVARMKKVFVL
jgi:hypothetical protein